MREAEVVVGLPPALVAERDGKLRPEDFVVRVGAEPRTVLRLVPLARESAPWRLVVVVDPALAHPDTIVASLLALAREAEALASFGDGRLETHHQLVAAPLVGGQALHVEIPFPAGADPSIDPTAVAVLLQAIGSEAAWGERFTQRN